MLFAFVNKKSCEHLSGAAIFRKNMCLVCYSATMSIDVIYNVSEY